MSKNLLPIAQEGWNYIAYSMGAFLFFFILDLELLSILALFLSAFLIFSFRNPERELPRFELNSVLSPVDGTIMSIEELEDTQYRYKIAIESTYSDVSILRVPMDTTVKSFSYKHGSKLNLDTALAQNINENASIIFEDSNNNNIKIVHLVKQSFFGIKLGNMKEKSLVQSARYGVMVNGMTYLYLPQNFRLNVNSGETLKASNSLIGYFS